MMIDGGSPPRRGRARLLARGWQFPAGWLAASASACLIATGAAAAPVPMVTGGLLIGVAGLGDSGCADEACGPYVVVGTIVSVTRQPKTDLPTGFRLRNARGEHNLGIDADWQGASMLDVRRIQRYLKPGRVVLVIGKRVGEKQALVASELLSADFAQKMITAEQDATAADRDPAKPR
jgi:hypothetical protein